MPQLTDRTKLPYIVDPVIRDTMDPKHLYQVTLVTLSFTFFFYGFLIHGPNDILLGDYCRLRLWLCYVYNPSQVTVH